MLVSSSLLEEIGGISALETMEMVSILVACVFGTGDKVTVKVSLDVGSNSVAAEASDSPNVYTEVPVGGT